MTTTTNTKTIPMGVSNTILTKAPRFFGSSLSILTELFQNSFRAKAENVQVIWEPEKRILIFKDDGRGCNPEDLIVVGGSGWDETSPAVDPAGIGVFSILRPEYCEKVTYRSKNWEMTLTPDDLTRAQANVKYFEWDIPGMTITIILTPKADFATKESIQRARGRYPMNVTWCSIPGGEIAVTTEPVLEALCTILNIEGVGALEIGKKDFSSYNVHFAVWQHAVLKSDALGKALGSAAAKHSSLAKHIFAHINCVLDVEPASGIRPKLPDRNDLINDHHLDAAAEKIVAQVMDYLLKPLRPELWPNDVNDRSYRITRKEGMEDQMSALDAVLTEIPDDAVIRKIVNVSMGTVQAIMHHFGYKRVSWDNIPEYSHFTIQDDGMQIEMEWESNGRYVRNIPIVAVSNEVLAQSLCSQGTYAMAERDVKDKVRIIGKRHAQDGLVAFARSIHVNGMPVQWLLNDDYDGHRWPKNKPGPLFFTSLSPAEFYKSVKSEAPDFSPWVSMVLWMLYRDGDIYEYAELESAEYELRLLDIADDLCQDSLAIGAPELLDMAQKKGAFSGALEELEEAERHLRYAHNRLANSYPEEEITRTIEHRYNSVLRLTKKIHKDINAMDKKLDEFMKE